MARLCSSQPELPPIGQRSQGTSDELGPAFSFSQPVHPDHMILSQFPCTPGNSQVSKKLALSFTKAALWIPSGNFHGKVLCLFVSFFMPIFNGTHYVNMLGRRESSVWTQIQRVFIRSSSNVLAMYMALISRPRTFTSPIALGTPG